MHISVFNTPRAAARALASAIATAIADRPRLVLGLPTGRTPIPLYRELVALYRAGAVDFSRVTTFNVDEFVGVAGGDRRSYRVFMQRHLFDHVNLSPRRIHFLNGVGRDVKRTCTDYDRAIVKAGGIDLQVLGLGPNGHVGFNEPARALHAWTHRGRLAAVTRRANRSLFGNRTAQVPAMGLSMGMATILRAGRIALLATGGAKAAAVARLRDGRVTTAFPASFLQLHRDVTVWLDRAAATGLQTDHAG